MSSNTNNAVLVNPQQTVAAVQQNKIDEALEKYAPCITAVADWAGQKTSHKFVVGALALTIVIPVLLALGDLLYNIGRGLYQLGLFVWGSTSKAQETLNQTQQRQITIVHSDSTEPILIQQQTAQNAAEAVNTAENGASDTDSDVAPNREPPQPPAQDIVDPDVKASNAALEDMFRDLEEQPVINDQPAPVQVPHPGRSWKKTILPITVVSAAVLIGVGVYYFGPTAVAQTVAGAFGFSR